MHTSGQRSGCAPASTRGPSMFVGFCRRSRQFRMMDLPDFMDNMQAGWSQMMTDGSSSMQRMWSGGGPAPWSGAGMSPWSGAGMSPMSMTQPWGSSRGNGCGCGCGCGCDGGVSGRRDCGGHCECCVCDADVLVHARCGEIRRIPLTFENDTRRDKPVTLTLENFVTSGGRDLGWTAKLSETQFTLRPCDEQTVSIAVHIVCKDDTTKSPPTPVPGGNPDTAPGATPVTPTTNVIPGVTPIDIFGTVDRCEVGYATIRADGCLTRPVVVAVAVLPDDCDAFRHPCGCGCCGDH